MSYKMKTYAFELACDGGRFFVRVYATNWTRAIELVCSWQNCPKSAILWKSIVK